MKTKLDLMQKIYELSGVEPDWWFSLDSYIHGRYETLSKWKKYEEYKPYYPLEQVLRELPGYISGKGRLDKNMLHYTRAINAMESSTWGFEAFELKDYHQAALRLWLKVLEEKNND